MTLYPYRGYCCFENFWQSGKRYEGVDDEKVIAWWKKQEKGRRRCVIGKGKKITHAEWEDFDNIKLMQEANETGGFVSWNTFRLMSERKTKNAVLTVSSDWIKDAQCINPITWNNNKTSVYDNHKGFLYLNKKVYPKSVKIENMDSKIYVKLPKMGIFKKLMVSTVKDYHKADINLFWEDIRINSLVRARTFLENEN